MDTKRIVRPGPLPWLFAVYWLFVASLLVAHYSGRQPCTAVGISVLSGCLVMRTARLGIRVDSGTAYCVDWFHTRRVPIEALVCSRSIGYSGALNRGGISRYFSIIEITAPPGRPVRLQCTIARDHRVKAQVATLIEAAADLNRAK